MLTDPFDVVFTGDVALRALVDPELCETLLIEYRLFLQECLRTRGLVVASNGWLVAAPEDALVAYLSERTEDDLVELAPPDGGGIDFDELSYGIALDGADDVAFWFPTFGGALVVPGTLAAGRRVIEPLYTQLAVVVRLGGDGLDIDDELATTVIDAFWEVAGEHVELRDVAARFGVAPLERQIEHWLGSHLEVLVARYGRLRLAPEGRLVARHGGHARVDLACRRDGGWLLVEVRRGGAGTRALAQLDRSLDLARAELTNPDETVEGLLVAERATPGLADALATRADVRFTDIASLLAAGS
jgi:hypothetical protein